MTIRAVSHQSHNIHLHHFWANLFSRSSILFPNTHTVDGHYKDGVASLLASHNMIYARLNSKCEFRATDIRLNLVITPLKKWYQLRLPKKMILTYLPLAECILQIKSFRMQMDRFFVRDAVSMNPMKLVFSRAKQSNWFHMY